MCGRMLCALYSCGKGVVSLYVWGRDEGDLGLRPRERRGGGDGKEGGQTCVCVHLRTEELDDESVFYCVCSCAAGWSRRMGVLLGCILMSGGANTAPPGNGKRVGIGQYLATTAPPGNGPRQQEQRPPPRAKTAPPGNGPR